MAKRTAKVASGNGLHARPAAVFANAAAEYDSDVTIEFDGDSADAASLMEVMTLGVKCGDEVTLVSDDEEALDKLVQLLESDLDKE